MKKFLSLAVSAVMALGTAGTALTSSVISSAADTDGDFVLFGDSIAEGYTRTGYVEHNYGEICADYLGGTATNYAVSGDTTDDLVTVIENLDSAQKTVVSDAEYIIISAGGNDIIKYSSKYLLNYAANKNVSGYNFLNDGYTAADIPEDPTLQDVMNIVNLRGKGGMMEFANASTNNILELSNQLTMLTSHLRISNETYDGYIINHIIPNLKTAIEDLQAINPNATIIIQSIYNPLELSPEYLTNRYGANSTYANMLGIVRTKFAKVMKNYKDCINDIATSYENVKVADILSEFDALKDGESQSDSNPGHAYYFIDNQPAVEIKDADIHPNQKGHLAIAAKILDTIGIYHDDNGLLSSVYESIADKADYPEVPLATFTKVAGNYSTKLMGDVNGDGIVNAVDASAILTYFAIMMTDQTPTMKFDKSVADYNNDGIINSIDASAILTYYANSMITK
ncbi:MAG: GDSL-type esterase/lipase family protein [Ruminococcus sp.]|nr:GDSL-type esterase/lipase family protein [Ruminococcus sp.]